MKIKLLLFILGLATIIALNILINLFVFKQDLVYCFGFTPLWFGVYYTYAIQIGTKLLKQ